MESPCEDVQTEEGHTAGEAGGRTRAAGATRPWEHTDQVAWRQRTGTQACLGASAAFAIIGDRHNSSSRLFQELLPHLTSPCVPDVTWKLWRHPGTKRDLLQLAIACNHTEATRFFVRQRFQRHHSYLGTVSFSHIHLLSEAQLSANYLYVK